MHSLLMITSILGAENCAAALSAQLGFSVEIASSRREGLARLRRHEYTIVVVDDAIAEFDPEGAELLWKHAGLAVPVQINFAISGTARLVREIRAQLARSEPSLSPELSAKLKTVAELAGTLQQRLGYAG